MVRELRWSLPYERLIAVMHARPRLASQAPNVRIMITNISQVLLVSAISIRIRLRIIDSRAKRVISKWWRWITTHVRVISTRIGQIRVIQDIIERRKVFLFLVYKTSASGY